MKLSFSPEDEKFRQEAADWLEAALADGFQEIRFRGGPGDEHMFFEERCAWEKVLAEGRWIGIGWPEEHGGRNLSLARQVLFHEEYARAGGPGRVGHIGETLAAPTIIAFGTDEQRRRFLPGILSGEELWCQGYSEPNAGSDLANVETRAHLDEKTGEWVLNGQKVWTSLALEADWCFVVARCLPDSKRHRGLCYLLVPMKQPGIEVRPIQQMTGTSEFNEVFFADARTAQDNIVGKPGEGWKVAMATLGFERGVSTLGQQMNFLNEFREVVKIAKSNGADRDPVIRQRLADAWIGLRIMRCNSLRILSNSQAPGREALIAKLYWATWHREFGKLALDILGPEAEILQDFPYQLSHLQSVALFSHSDTIYAGTNQIQRNIISERGLNMPKKPH